MNGGSRGARHRWALASLLTIGLLSGCAVAGSPSAGAASSGTAPPMVLTASAPVANVGAPLTLTATVAEPAPNSFTFTFYANGAAQTCLDGTTHLPSGSVGQSCTIAQVPGPTGVATFTAEYQPSSGAPATAAAEVTVLPAVTTVTVSAPAVAQGAEITYTATVSSPAGAVGGGTVSFTDDGTAISGCTSQPVSTTTATCAIASGYPSAGTYDVQAAYQPPGGTDLGPGVAGTVEAVGGIATGEIATTTTLAVSSTTPELGAPVTLGATVTSQASPPSPPTGRVTFTDAGVALPGCQSVLVQTAAGSDQSGATCQITAGYNLVAPHLLQALFLPAQGSGLAGSASIVQLVEPAPAADALTMTATPDPAPQGAAVSLSLALAAPQVAATLPQVRLDPPSNGTSITCPGATGDVVPLSGGAVTCTVTSLPLGVSTIGATFIGDLTDADLLGATDQLPVTVDPALGATTVQLTASPDPATVGEGVTYTATVTSATNTTPSGTVTFVAVGSGGQACTETTSLRPIAGSSKPTSSATCTVSGYGSTGYVVESAIYGDDGANPPASGAMSEPIDSASVSLPSNQPIVTLSPPANLSIGHAPTFVTSVANPGGSAPTGTVTFLDDGSPMGGCAPLALPQAPAGSDTAVVTCNAGQAYDTSAPHDIVVTYSGDASLAGGSAARLVSATGANADFQLAIENGMAAGGTAPPIAPIFSAPFGHPSGTLTITDASTGSSCGNQQVTPSPPVCNLPLPPPNSGTMLVATYSGDATYLPAVASLGEETIATGTSLANLNLSVTPGATGVQVQVSASGSSSTPTGTVQVTDDGAPLAGCGTNGTVTLDGGSASCSTGTSMTVGVHTIVATYAGDPTYLPAAALAEVPVGATTPATGSSSGGGAGGGGGLGGGGLGGGGGPAPGGSSGAPSSAGGHEAGSPSSSPSGQATSSPTTTTTPPTGHQAAPHVPGAPALDLRVPLTAPPGRPVVYRLRVAGGAGPLAGSVTFRIDGRPVRGCSRVRLTGGRALQVTCRLPGGLTTPGYRVVSAAYSGGAGYRQTSVRALEQIVPSFTGGWLVTAAGGLWRAGGVPIMPDDVHPRSPAVAAAMVPDGRGLWILERDGAVLAVGAARSFGSPPAGKGPYVAIAPTRDGRGYWVLARDGALQRFGNAPPLAGARSTRATGPFVALAPTPDGRGCWLLSAEGTVVARGDAALEPPRSRPSPPGPFVGIAPSVDGRGYTLLTAAGRLAAFGDAPAVPVVPPTTARAHAGPFVGLLRLAGHRGLWLATLHGHLFPVGRVPRPALRPPRPPGHFVALAGT